MVLIEVSVFYHFNMLHFSVNWTFVTGKTEGLNGCAVITVLAKTTCP